jgi:hypothetical protein
MTVSELLLHLTRIVFIGFTVIATVDLLRHRDKLRIDIMLLFLSVTSGTFFVLLRWVIGAYPPQLSIVVAWATIAQPYLLLRIVKHFHYVSPLVEKVAIAGMLVSWGFVLYLGMPLSQLGGFTFVAYLILVNGYSTVIFIRGAFIKTGIVRYRLRLAAMGSVMLIGVLAASGIRIFVPSLSPDITSIVQLFAILSAVLFYISFVPPRWLYASWEYSELHKQLGTSKRINALREDISKIFISYSRKDGEFARNLANSLSSLGASIWIDTDDVPLGVKWSSAIQNALDSTHIMLVIISPDSMASRNVEDEWQYYLDEGKFIVPIWWRPAKVHYQLKRLQYVDFHEKPFDLAFERLCSQLNASYSISTRHNVWGGP